MVWIAGSSPAMTAFGTPVRFVPLSFAEIEGWLEDDHAAAFAALLQSLRRRPANEPMAIAARHLGDELGGGAARKFFEQHFTPHRVVVGSHPPGLVTGYYEPEVAGSRQASDRFRFPVLGRPDDLISITPDTLRASFNDRISGFRDAPGNRVPYFTRAEIDAGVLMGRGLELVFLDDPVELFFMQVQGSGLVRLEEGGFVRLTYAAKNGHAYTSIGRLLVERGELAREGLTMDVLKAWLRPNPERGRRLMQENASYVFFRELSEDEGRDGPLGAKGVPLTAGRSLAVDASYHQLGLPIFVSAPELGDENGRPFRRLMIAQDVGSAIRGPQRGDIFWGSGAAAGDIAGATCAPAALIVLLPKR